MRRPDEPVLLHREGRAGHIVLNRPRALNALTHVMVLRIHEALSAWEEDDGVSVVVLSGAGDRGLCAGGDIRAIHDDVRSGGGEASAAFWRDEYRLNSYIARYPKPYVALMDGVVMGGGVGVSAHGGVRVVTERSAVAMPETGIGFVPDVGGTHLLSRAPGGLGNYLALSASSVGAADAMRCGLADHCVPSDRLGDFTAALAHGDVEGALGRFTAPPPEPVLDGHREWIDSCCTAGTVEEILERLRAHGGTAAKEAAGAIEEKSPTALKVTLAALDRARHLESLEAVLDQEFRVSCAMLSAPDFVEGVRARVVDKDRAPRWSPARLEDVGRRDVESCFAPLGDRELGLATL